MKRALLVIDVQNEYFSGRLQVKYPEGSLINILHAMDAAKEHGLPVIAVQHTSSAAGAKTFARGTYGWELHDAVKAKGYDRLVEKNLPGSFTDTNLETLLRENGCDTVAIAGYMTQMCCDTTARQAFHLGFNVEFLSDATGTLDISNSAGSIKAQELHKAALITQAARFSAVMTLKEWERHLI